MEKKFLLYILYITLIEVREYSYLQKNERLFWLTDMIHNIPFELDKEEDVKNAYKKLLEDVKKMNISDWFETREKEFYSRFPEYK